jgi:hypothetical protein
MRPNPKERIMAIRETMEIDKKFRLEKRYDIEIYGFIWMGMLIVPTGMKPEAEPRNKNKNITREMN